MGWIDKLGPARIAKGKIDWWKTKEQAIAALQKKSPFNAFTKASFEDFIHHGITAINGGYGLNFDKQVKYSIHKTIPDNLSDFEKN